MHARFPANFIAWFIRRHIADREAAAAAAAAALAREEGYASGHRAGEAAGYQQGLAEGKWVIDDRRAAVPMQPLDASIYGPKRFAITDELKQMMRAQVDAAVARGVVNPPTASQWEMIFSEHPATCVAAGAGSGKSTTLVLRVALMLAHLKIAPEDITVVTFTRNAAKDLREKLLLVLVEWGYAGANEKLMARLVRTFHSVLAQMGRTAFPGKSFFEILEDAKGDVENPLSSTRLKSVQLEHLNDAYRQCYGNNTEFARHVNAIAKLICDRDVGSDGGEEAQDWMVKAVAARDKELVERINARWAEFELLPDGGLELGCFELGQWRGHKFYANARVAASGVPVVLGNFRRDSHVFRNNEVIGGENGQRAVTMGQAIGIKRNVLSRYCGSAYVYVDNPRSLARLRLRLEIEDTTASKNAPLFNVRLSGELSESSLPEAFWSQASFIESLDLEVADTIAKLRFREENLDFHFCAALRLFWPHFESWLLQREPKLITFNRGFLLLAHDPAARSAIPISHLCSLTHVLIDEFQDISPQIVSWIKAGQRKLAAAGRHATIMAIGDDWQSVYGWRGSAPEFFINFEEHFPVHEAVAPARRLLMVENHRSVEPIVHDAKALLDPVNNKVDKPAKAQKAAGPGDHGVVLVIADLKKDVEKHAEFILTRLKEESQRSPDHKTQIIVLCRTNRTSEALQEKIGKKPGLAYHTFHSAKGLQGQTAILFEDAEYDAVHVLRNAVYSLARTERGSKIFRQTYDEAMRDEAYRLAYVAVTRGMRRVFWFVEAQKQAARQLNLSKGAAPSSKA